MFYRIISSIVIVAFILANVVSPSSAQVLSSASIQNFSVDTGFKPVSTIIFSDFPLLNGIKIYPQEPFRFDFLLTDRHSGRSEESRSEIFPVAHQDDANNEESLKLIKYFMASLAIPEGDLWVNLSPDEPDRIVPQALGQTEMGKDLLYQDYLLKQLTASLLSPDSESGKKLWDKVYQSVYKKSGSVEIPIESFNRVWIVPAQASVYQNGDTAYIVEARLKVMMEEDYNNLSSQRKLGSGVFQDDLTSQDARSWTKTFQDDSVKNIIREIIIPLIEDEVNNGETFVNLRQIYHSMILAQWFKQNLKNSIVGQMYVNRNTVEGIQLDDSGKQVNQIYQSYLQAFQIGLNGLVKEEYDSAMQNVVARKYIVGGFDAAQMSVQNVVQRPVISDQAALVIQMRVEPINQAMLEDVTEADKNLLKEKIEDAYWRRVYGYNHHLTLLESSEYPNAWLMIPNFNTPDNMLDFVKWSKDHLGDYMWPFTILENVRVFGERKPFVVIFERKNLMSAQNKSYFDSRDWAKESFQNIWNRFLDIGVYRNADLTNYDLFAFDFTARDQIKFFDFAIEFFTSQKSRFKVKSKVDDVRLSVVTRSQIVEGYKYFEKYLYWSQEIRSLEDIRNGGIAFSRKFERFVIFDIQENQRIFAKFLAPPSGEEISINGNRKLGLYIDRQDLKHLRFIPEYVYLNSRLQEEESDLYSALKKYSSVWSTINIKFKDWSRDSSRFLSKKDFIPRELLDGESYFLQWNYFGFLERQDIQDMTDERKINFINKIAAWREHKLEGGFSDEVDLGSAIDYFFKMTVKEFLQNNNENFLSMYASDFLMIKSGFYKDSKDFKTRVIRSYFALVDVRGEPMSDSAMMNPVKDSKTGGIDMNELDVQTQGTMTTVSVPVDQAMLNQNIQGFRPVIINILPMTTHQFLGWMRENKTSDADFPQDKLPEKEHLYIKEI